MHFVKKAIQECLLKNNLNPVKFLNFKIVSRFRHVCGTNISLSQFKHQKVRYLLQSKLNDDITICKFFLQRNQSQKPLSEENTDNSHHFENKNWENILGNEEKKNNIAQIPVVRENVFTIPNAISLSRILITPYISYLVISHQYNLALGLFVVAGISDLVDGQIARIWPSQQSAVGSALDPLGDKILVTCLTLSLTSAGIIPAPLTILIVGRDLALITAVFYLRYRTCPPPVTLKRYFDPTLVNTKLSPTTISKFNTGIQMLAISASMCAPVWNFIEHPGLKALYILTAITTVWSGASYILSKNTVRILKDSQKS